MEKNSGVSSLFTQMLQAKRLPTGDHIAGCTNELRELMEFVDTLVEKKQTENKLQISEWKKKYSERNNEFHQLNANFQIKDSQAKDLEVKLKNSSSQLVEFENRFGQLTSELNDLKKKHDDHRKKCSREIKALRVDRSKLKERISSETDLSDSTKLKIEGYKSSIVNISNLNKAYKSEIDEIKIKSTNKIEKLNDIIAEKETNLKEIQIQNSENSKKPCLGKNCDFFNNIEKSKKEISLLKKQSSELQSKYDELKLSFDIKNNEIEKLKEIDENNNIEEIKKRVSATEQQNQKFKIENCRLIEELNELAWKLEDLQIAKSSDNFYDGESIISDAERYNKNFTKSKDKDFSSLLRSDESLSSVENNDESSRDSFPNHAPLYASKHTSIHSKNRGSQNSTQKPSINSQNKLHTDPQNKPHADTQNDLYEHVNIDNYNDVNDESTFDTTVLQKPNFIDHSNDLTVLTCDIAVNKSEVSDDVTSLSSLTNNVTNVDFSQHSQGIMSGAFCTSERALAELRLASTINDYESRISSLQRQLSEKSVIIDPCEVNDNDLTIVSSTPSEHFVQKLEKICDNSGSEIFSNTEIENSVDRLVSLSNIRSENSIKWFDNLVDQRVTQHLNDLQMAI